jgi:excinuclease UvrABC nuclease subunit
MKGDGATVADVLSKRMGDLSTQQRFEEAASVRDRLSSLLSATTTARLVDASLAAGTARFDLAGITHEMHEGLLNLEHLGISHRFDTGTADTNAERILVARMIQRAATQGRTLRHVNCSGEWHFPVAEIAVERLTPSVTGDPNFIDVDDANLPASE